MKIILITSTINLPSVFLLEKSTVYVEQMKFNRSKDGFDRRMGEIELGLQKKQDSEKARPGTSPPGHI